MTQQEYEQKREQEWRTFCNRHGLDRGHVMIISAFFEAFDRAYALGREKEIISQDEIDKAAEDYVSFKKGGKCILSYIIERACRRAFKGGANFALGKQEKDAEGEETLICEKSKVQRAYNTSREIVKAENPDSLMYSMHTQIMCVLESIFGSKCLPDELNEDNFAKSEPKPAESKNAEGEEILTCEKSKAMQLYSNFLDLVESERMSEHYSKWCDLEGEYIALFGKNAFADYFGVKCLPSK